MHACLYEREGQLTEELDAHLRSHRCMTCVCSLVQVIDATLHYKLAVHELWADISLFAITSTGRVLDALRKRPSWLAL